jgi:hypothetical protein
MENNVRALGFRPQPDFVIRAVGGNVIQVVESHDQTILVTASLLL